MLSGKVKAEIIIGLLTVCDQHYQLANHLQVTFQGSIVINPHTICQCSGIILLLKGGEEYSMLKSHSECRGCSHKLSTQHFNDPLLVLRDLHE